jgi:hypothetical protein
MISDRADNLAALERFSKRRILRVMEYCQRGTFHGDMLLAVGLRETWLQNILGDYGHGRGVFQQDDRWQQAWLQSVRGCRSGSFVPVYTEAYTWGRVPTLKAGTLRAKQILEENLQYAKNEGVPGKKLFAFSLAAYNAGPYSALKGFQEGNVDKYTANGNYSADVLERRDLVIAYRERYNIKLR